MVCEERTEGGRVFQMFGTAMWNERQLQDLSEVHEGRRHLMIAEYV